MSSYGSGEVYRKLQLPCPACTSSVPLEWTFEDQELEISNLGNIRYGGKNGTKKQLVVSLTLRKKTRHDGIDHFFSDFSPKKKKSKKKNRS